jgi:hypothetical protein
MRNAEAYIVLDGKSEMERPLEGSRGKQHAVIIKVDLKGVEH